MRDFGIFAPTFWTRGTGKEIRGDQQAQLIALYLMSAPTANMIGLYYLPITTIAHDTGIPFEGASKGLRRLCEVGFCEYDHTSEVVFVRTMASRQLRLDLDTPLAEKDKRWWGVERMMRECGSARLLQLFWDRYRVPLRLPEPWWEAPSKGLRGGSEGASRGLRARDQDQDQDQDQDLKYNSQVCGGHPDPAPTPAAPPLSADAEAPSPKSDESDPWGLTPVSSVKPTIDTQVRQVFEAWQIETNHPKSKLDAKRKSRIRSRLKDGFTVEQLIRAIRNRKFDPFLMGSNDATKVYDGIQTLLRDYAQVERLLDLGERNHGRSPARPGGSRGGLHPEALAGLGEPEGVAHGNL